MRATEIGILIELQEDKMAFNEDKTWKVQRHFRKIKEKRLQMEIEGEGLQPQKQTDGEVVEFSNGWVDKRFDLGRVMNDRRRRRRTVEGLIKKTQKRDYLDNEDDSMYVIN